MAPLRVLGIFCVAALAGCVFDTDGDGSATGLDSSPGDGAQHRPVCGDGRVSPTEACDTKLSACCASDCTGRAPQGAVCNPSERECDATEMCDGESYECPEDVPATDGTECGDTRGRPDGMCQSGTCTKFPASCKEILDADPDATTRNYEVLNPAGPAAISVPIDQVTPTTVPVFCDMDNGGWTLVYKKVKGRSASAKARWESRAPVNETMPEIFPRDVSSHDYVSAFVIAWDDVSPAQVRVEVVEDVEVKRYIEFEAKDKGKLGWFAPENWRQSDWTDLPTDSAWEESKGQFFSIAGSDSADRYFYINATWDGCPEDQGWLMVSHGNDCVLSGWEDVETEAEIIYSKHPNGKKAKFSDPSKTGYADSLMIYIR